MQVCFTSDLHGVETLYAQLDALVAAERPGLLILGGDNVIDADRANPLGSQVRYIRQVLTPRLEAWRSANPELIVGIIPGNHEWRCAWDEYARLEERGWLRRLSLTQPLQAGGLSFLGYGCTPPTPYHAKDFERLDFAADAPPAGEAVGWDVARQRAERLDPAAYFRSQPAIADDLAAVRPPAGPWVLVCHAPPYDTTLDRLIDLPEPVGSRAVRAFIERTQPTASLHGHLHDSPELSGTYVDRIGATLAVNPGQQSERLHAVMFDTRDIAGTLRHTVMR